MSKIVKKLNSLLDGITYEVVIGKLTNIEINKLCYDSRKVESNDLFICLKGARYDSHDNIIDVIKNGASVIVINENFANENIGFLNSLITDNKTVFISVANTRHALAIISSNYFDNPAHRLKIIGITGTKGKTTTSFMIRDILSSAGYNVGMIGTIGIFYGDKHIITDNTTPESYTLHEYFSKMLDAGIEYVVMEVSSQSLKYNRVDGIVFYFAIWTMILPEHIGQNEHDDYNDYLYSKLKIFSQCSNALINSFTDDYDKVISAIKNNTVLKYYEKKVNRHFNLRIPGNYNEENASLAYEFGKAIGISDDTIINSLKNTVVPGRIEKVYENDEFIVIVDFSYEGNGAKRFLDTIREKYNDKRIITIFGCGGNRSKDRRYTMGNITGEMADFVILTSDNSRFEKTRDIIKDIESTLSKYKIKDNLDNGYIIIEDRKDAIEYAIKNHKKGDVICVMGKGHEPYMEMNGEKIRFLDKEIVLSIIDNLYG